MLVLTSRLRFADGLAFAPDGQALVVVGENALEVWPRWLEAPPNPVVTTHVTLERTAFGTDGRYLFQYLSANSRARVLTVATARDAGFGLPRGPTWFHFTPEGGYFIVSHGRDRLSRFDFAPGDKKLRREVWTVARLGGAGNGPRTYLCSHYAFGGVCGAVGRFVALECVRPKTGSKPSLVVRSVADGSIVEREEVPNKNRPNPPLYLIWATAFDPLGRCFAYPGKKTVCVWPLGVEGSGLRVFKYAERAACRAVAFHPSGQWLAAVGDDAQVKVYDTASWELARTFDWGIGPLWAVCFSADGTRAAVIGPGRKRASGKRTESKIVVWDVDL
jgi:WD40 repeat protein